MWSLFSSARRQSLMARGQTTRFLIGKNSMRHFSQPPKHSADTPSPDTLMDSQITCLMLHPVTWPNHGPHKELYLAEEAIGLVRSLDWEVARGPLWQEEEGDESQKDENHSLRKYLEDDPSANET